MIIKISVLLFCVSYYWLHGLSHLTVKISLAITKLWIFSFLRSAEDPIRQQFLSLANVFTQNSSDTLQMCLGWFYY